ncbi:MAG: AAA family ATPase [Candidatus Omnitrophica bacterium]|nr:AAA family ATPase [Candidatus Omnitrophota bacterium]
MYERFFGLNEPPFNVTPDPKFVYFSKKHQDAFASLVYGIEYKKGFIEITGEIGAGKTTLCRTFLSRMGNKIRSAMIFNPNLSDAQLLATIVEDFGIKPRSKNKKAYFDGLNSFLLDELASSRTAVLIIDEAQNLKPRSLEQIRLLSNLETDREKLLQIVLVGQPELREILSDSSLVQLRQRIGIRFHLSALDRTETEEYITHRIKVAGGEGKLLFAPSAIDYIYRYSKGIPRLINVLCDKSLLAAFVKEASEVHEGLVEAAQNEIEGVLV